MPRTNSIAVTRPSNSALRGPIDTIDKAITEICNTSEMVDHDLKNLCLLYLDQVDRLITVVEQNHRNAMHALNHVRNGLIQALEAE